MIPLIFKLQLQFILFQDIKSSFVIVITSVKYFEKQSNKEITPYLLIALVERKENFICY